MNKAIVLIITLFSLNAFAGVRTPLNCYLKIGNYEQGYEHTDLVGRKVGNKNVLEITAPYGDSHLTASIHFTDYNTAFNLVVEHLDSGATMVAESRLSQFIVKDYRWVRFQTNPDLENYQPRTIHNFNVFCKRTGT